MKLLAFMQNAWFPPGTKREHVDRYITDQEFHRRLLARTMSGSRLLQAFGPAMFAEIHWDNVSTKVTDTPSGVGEIDSLHVERVIHQVKPGLIMAFGRLAEQALDRSILAMKIPYMVCHHPNARHKTMQDLADFAVEVQQEIERMKVS